MEKKSAFFLTNLLRRDSQKTKPSEEKGWGNTIDFIGFNGWGSSIGSTSSEPITNGWADEPSEDHFNGWGPTSSSDPSSRPPTMETTSTEWIHEHPKDEYHGWGSSAGLTIPMHDPHASRPRKVESWFPTLPSAPPLPDDNFDDENKLIANISSKDALCVVCWEAKVEGACVPCGHMASCMACLHEIESTQGTCPICRADIDKVMRIYAIQTE